VKRTRGAEVVAVEAELVAVAVVEEQQALVENAL